jgi:mannitol/fructose-specific phosphotransferase system IIA component (Ntr-type)
MIDIRALLSREHIVFELAGASRRDILRALTEPLAAESAVTSIEEFLNDLEAREDEITTQIGDRVALPHARSAAVRRLALVVGIADKSGLAFNPEVSETCRLFFLIGVPALAPTAHLPLLQHLANFAHDSQRVARLLAATNHAQVVRCLAAGG